MEFFESTCITALKARFEAALDYPWTNRTCLGVLLWLANVKGLCNQRAWSFGYHNSHYSQWQTNKNMAWIHLNLNTTPRRKPTRSQVCKILQPIQQSVVVCCSSYMDIIRELANHTEFVALFDMTYRLNIIILVNMCTFYFCVLRTDFV